MRSVALLLWISLFLTLASCGGGGKPSTPPADTVAPVIILSGANPTSLVQGSNYTDAGATANDNRDGSVNVTSSGSVDSSAVGEYTISYTASDSAGNSTTKTRTVNVTLAPVVETPDTTPPVITVSGDNPVSIVQGSSYTDAGATATDDKDGSVDVSSAGLVDTTKVGVYTITYTATDSSGNDSNEIRTINVNAPPSAQKITISGQTAHQTINNGLVIVVDKSGTELGRTRTKADGSFSVEVAENKIASGYGLTVTEGKVGEVDFVGSMKSFYSAPHANDKANITVMTTLIDKVAENTGSYETAIQKLSNIGMTQSTDWFEVDQKKVEEDFLGFKVQQEESLDQWIEKIATDIADDDLSAVNMYGVFLQAHGGILSINIPAVNDDGQLYFFKDYEKKASGIANKTDSVNSSQWEIVNPPRGVEIDSTSGEIVINKNFNLGDTKITLKLTGNNGFRTKQVNLAPLNPITLIDEKVSGGAELFSDQYNLVQISINEFNSIPKGTGIKLIAAPKKNGLWSYKFISDYKDIDTASISLLLPSNGELDAAYSINTLHKKIAMTDDEVVVLNTSFCSSTARYKWKNYPSVFFIDRIPVAVDNSIVDKIIGTKYRISNPLKYRDELYGRFKVILSYLDSNNGFDDIEVDDASLLCGRSLYSSIKKDGRVPILFIHGYTPFNSMGGGQGTWGSFLSYADKWELKGKKTAVFEFKWRTNARFQTVANDLKDAIKIISERTGEKVHIIAHSFGGVLARTYLQGLADGSDYSIPVASLTTIGTPHSGLGSSGGYDSTISATGGKVQCGQITCFQMGDGSRNYIINKISNENEITNKLATYKFKLIEGTKEQLPIKVLLGSSVKKTGDGLISLEGQRFKPSFIHPQGLNIKKEVNNAIIIEKLLNKNNFSKYRFFTHTSLHRMESMITVAAAGHLVGSTSSPEVEVKSKKHPSVIETQEWIGKHIPTPVVFNKITYDIFIEDYLEKPVSEIQRITSTDYNSFNLSNGNLKVSFDYVPQRKIKFRIIPKNGSGLLPPAEAISFTMPSNYDGRVIRVPTTITLRKTNKDTTYSSKISTIEKSGKQLAIKGEGFEGEINIIARAFNRKDRKGTITQQSPSQILVSFNSLLGIQKICVQKYTSTNELLPEICKKVVFKKKQDGSILIDSLNPSSINASIKSQKITIHGSGFTPDAKVYYRNSSSSNVLSSSSFIDANTMIFKLKTFFDNPSWKIWVEDDENKSNELEIIVDTNVNTLCEAGDKKIESCTISHGVGKHFKTCGTDGNSWGYFSDCEIVQCDDDYVINNNVCIKGESDNPDVPVINSSLDIKSDSISLSWSVIEGAIEYQLELIDEEGSENQTLKVDAPKTNAKFENLKPEHRYQIKVRAKNSETEGDYSQPLKFKTLKKEVVPLDKAVAKSPGSATSPGAEITDKNLNLSLKKITRATHYWVRVDDVTAGSIFYENKNLEFTSFPTQKTLSVDHDYKWKVAACNADGCGEWSDYLYFKVIKETPDVPVPDKPSNLSPGNSSRESTEQLEHKDIILKWLAPEHATKYRLSLFDYNTKVYLFENKEVNEPQFDARSWVDSGHEYQWLVEACNTNNKCSSARKAYFKIKGQVVVPEKPLGLKPGSTIVGSPEIVKNTSQVLKWDKADNATWYKLRVSEGRLKSGGQFSSGRVVVREDDLEPTTYLLNNLEKGKQYVWWVEACNDDACNASSIFGFEVEKEADSLNPTVSGVNPDPIIASSSRQYITLTGNNFKRGSTVEWKTSSGNSDTVPSSRTTFVNASSIKVYITVPSTSSMWYFKVKNPDGKESDWKSVQVNTNVVISKPSISSISPDPIIASSSRQLITLNGDNFQSSSRVDWKTSSGGAGTVSLSGTNYVNANTIRINIKVTSASSSWSFKVKNSDGKESVWKSVQVGTNVVVPKPILTGINPDPIIASSSRQDITLTGNNFKSGSTVEWKTSSGNSDTVPSSRTTFVSANSIKVFITVPSGSSTWEFRIKNPDGKVSEWISVQVKTTVVITKPTSPNLISPGSSSAPGAEIINTKPELSWNVASGATHYWVAIHDVATDSNVFNEKNVQGTSITASGLTAGHKYKWDLTACNSAGCDSVWSQSLYFQVKDVVQKPVAPTITNQTITPTAISITWDQISGVDKYFLELVDLEGNDDRTKTVTQTAEGFSNLKSDHRYKVRVRAHNSEGYGDYSSFYEFKTKVEVVDAPSLVIVETVGVDAYVAWQDIESADRYRVRLYDEDSSFTDSKYVNKSPTVFKNLTAGHRYKVKVKARKNGVYGDYSDFEYFTIDEVTTTPCPKRHFTNNEISEYLQKGYRDGQNGKTQVAELQRFLNELGYSAGTSDGIFGNGTEQAVKDYQNDKGLNPDGKVGSATRAKINSTSCQ